MPLLPAGQLCIRRFARTFDGVTESVAAVRYKCRHRGDGATVDVGDVPHHRRGRLRRCRATGAGHGTSRQGNDDSPHRRLRALRGTRADRQREPRPGRHSLQRYPGTDRPHRLARWDSANRVPPRRTSKAGSRVAATGDYAKLLLHVILAGGGELATGTHAFPNVTQNRIIGTLVTVP